MGIDDIPQKESKSLDARKYKGLKIKIADKITFKDENGIDAVREGVRQEEVIDHWVGEPDDKGQPTYVAESTELVQVIVIETEYVPELDAEGKPTDKLTNITVKKTFNLKKEIDDAGKVIWVISKHAKAKLWAFMKNMEVKKLSELKGKYVVLMPKADKENPDKFWLRISD
jgi:hypothetical protein